METQKKELVYLPLGGVGEIGTNASLYGIKTEQNTQWILVDVGIGFCDESYLGTDIIYPDLSFIQNNKESLLGILITHAHEDHIGALSEMWSTLNVPIYLTKFSKTLLGIKQPFFSKKASVIEVDPLVPYTIGPFVVKFIPVMHSIPDSYALGIQTDCGKVLHTGDWKLQEGSDSDQFKQNVSEFCEHGATVLVCDSTNITRKKKQITEKEIYSNMVSYMESAPYRVVVTVFASNLERVSNIIKAAKAAKRKLFLGGRALKQIIEAGQDNQLIDPALEWYDIMEFMRFPRHECVLIMTGSQGEERSMLSQIALKKTPRLRLASGDCVIFSSQTIPGNEKPVAKVMNALIESGVTIITNQTDDVHVSGHPYREDVEQLYTWVKPTCVVPVHGEPYHIQSHARLAKQVGIHHVLELSNGVCARLCPGEPEVLFTVDINPKLRDGLLMISANDDSYKQRRVLARNGVISIAIVMSPQGKVLASPAIDLTGVPVKLDDKRLMIETIYKSIKRCLKDFNSFDVKTEGSVESLVEKFEHRIGQVVKKSTLDLWGKRPVCHVQILLV